MSPRMLDPEELEREKHRNGSEIDGSQGAKEREAQKWLQEYRIPRS